MGNQITTPSGQNWYLEDFEDLGFKTERSFFEGTFLLSFLCRQTTIFKNQIVVKAYKTPEENEEEAQSIRNIINSSKEFFDRQLKSKGFLHGNLITEGLVKENGVYMVRPYIQSSLQNRLADFPELNNSEKDWVAFQILAALKNLHQNGFYHGDIKPENILLTNRLQVLLADHAPHKPKYIRRNQPNYFLHFFSYSGGSAFIAPERIVNDEPQEQINLAAADLFSAGCILAYIYLGVSLFNFSSLNNFAAGDGAPLQKLEKIENEKIRVLIYGLLSSQAEVRQIVFDHFEDSFPPWFSRFRECFYSQKIDSCFMEKMVIAHDSLMQILPEDLNGDESLIYFNILQDVILSSGRAVALQILIEHYVELTIKYFDDRMKLARAIPPLFEIFDQNIGVSTIWALNGATKIFESINEIPEDYTNYGKAYIIPRLEVAMKGEWSSTFICDLPKWLLQMQKLFPQFISDIRNDISTFQHLFTVNTDITVSRGNDISNIGFVKGFLKSCADSGKCGNYELFYTLSFFIFPLLSTDYFFADIINFITSFYTNFDNFDKHRFCTNLEQQTLTAVLSSELSPERAAENVFSLTKLFDCGLPTNSRFYPTIYTTIQNYITSDIKSVSMACSAVISKMSEEYQMIYAATIILNNAKSDEHHTSKIERDNIRKARTIASTPPLRTRTKTSNTLVSPLTKMLSAETFSFKSGLFIASRIDENSVRQIFPIDSRHVIMQFDKHIMCVEIERSKFTISNDCHTISNIIDMCFIKDRTFVLCEGNSLHKFAYGLGIRRSCEEIGQLAGVAYCSDTCQIITFRNGSNFVQTRDTNTLSIINEFQASNAPIIDVIGIENTPFIVTLDTMNNICILDVRIQLPIYKFSEEGAVGLIRNPSLSLFGVKSKWGVSVFDVNKHKVIYDVEGNYCNAFFREDELVIVGQTGTFIASEDEFFSINSKGVRNPSKSYTIPNTVSTSLHGHLRPVTCGCSLGQEVLTGDLDGFVHLWSYVTDIFV